MKKLLAPLLLLLLAPALQAADSITVYRYVDKNGNVVYTDRPRDDAEAMEIEEPRTIKNERANPEALSSGNTDPQASAFSYTQFAIASPADGDVIRENSGNIIINVALSPSLRPEHRLRMIMDGALVADAQFSSTFPLSNVDRGEHVVKAEIVDSEGKVVQASMPSIFQLHRFSVQTRPNSGR